MNRLAALGKVADLCGSRILAILYCFLTGWPLLVGIIPLVFGLWLAIFGIFVAIFGIFVMIMLLALGVVFYVLTVSVVGVSSVALTGTLRWSRAWGKLARRAGSGLLDGFGDWLMDDVTDFFMDRGDGIIEVGEKCVNWYSPVFRPAERLWARSKRRQGELQEQPA